MAGRVSIVLMGQGVGRRLGQANREGLLRMKVLKVLGILVVVWFFWSFALPRVFTSSSWFHPCIVTGAGGKICGSDAASWCSGTVNLRQSAASLGVDTSSSEAACQTVINDKNSQ